MANNVMLWWLVIELSIDFMNILDLNCSSLETSNVNMLVCLRSWLSDDIWARNPLCHLLS